MAHAFPDDGRAAATAGAAATAAATMMAASSFLSQPRSRTHMDVLVANAAAATIAGDDGTFYHDPSDGDAASYEDSDYDTLTAMMRASAALSMVRAITRVEEDLDALFEDATTLFLLKTFGEMAGGPAWPGHAPPGFPVPEMGDPPVAQEAIRIRPTDTGKIYRWVASVLRLLGVAVEAGDRSGPANQLTNFLFTHRDEVEMCTNTALALARHPDISNTRAKRELEALAIKKHLARLEPVFAQLEHDLRGLSS